MTDKEMIIDGVDVSKCEYLQYKGCNFPQCLVKIASFDLKCEGYNCHLKRLVQKEQECETLKDKNFAFEELIKTQEEIIDKYKQALDKIEQEVKWVLDNKKSEWYTAIVKNVEYKQILDEIKEDISEYIKTSGFFEELDSNSAITRDEYIAICTRHNLASEINNIVKKCDKKD